MTSPINLSGAFSALIASQESVDVDELGYHHRAGAGVDGNR